jgi:GntR family transcriptional regulator
MSINTMSTYTDQRLDPDSYVPLYMQLVLLLQSAIEQGSLKAGDQLPSERELVERYGVSRITASNALQELVQSGLAYRRHGLGTFVARPKIRDLSGFASFSDDMRERGLAPSSRLLALEFLVPDEEVRKRLGLAPGASCIRLARVRLANGEPVAVENAYIPADLCPGLENADLEKGALYEVFRRHYGLGPAWAEGIIEAAPADEEQAALLDLEPGEPVLSIWRVTYDENYMALEWVHSVYRADRFSFSTGRHAVESSSRR